MSSSVLACVCRKSVKKSFGLKTGIHFAQFGLESGMDLDGILFICALIQVMMT